MILTPEKLENIRARIDQIRAWIDDEAPYVLADQRHLDVHTPERAYWHYGYLLALMDIVAGKTDASRKPGNEDISSQS